MNRDFDIYGELRKDAGVAVCFDMVKCDSARKNILSSYCMVWYGVVGRGSVYLWYDLGCWCGMVWYVT